MFSGFEKIVEARIRRALQEGEFDDLPGKGRPLVFAEDRHIPEDLRICYKILKNADFLPPEIELKKEIRRTEDLLAGMTDSAEKYRTLKKLNFLILKLNTMRNSCAEQDIPEKYEAKLVSRFQGSVMVDRGDEAC
jgi:hypothetical protein